MPYGKNLLDQVRHISDERNPIEYTGLRVGCTSPDLRVTVFERVVESQKQECTIISTTPSMHQSSSR